MTNLKFNGVQLTDETISKTRKHFSDICMGCIEETKSGKVRVNNLESFIEKKLDRAESYLNGTHQITFTFLQRAYFIQTGESVALLNF